MHVYVCSRRPECAQHSVVYFCNVVLDLQENKRLVVGDHTGFGHDLAQAFPGRDLADPSLACSRNDSLYTLLMTWQN